MKIIAYGYQLRTEDYETINNMCAFLTIEPWDIMDLRSFEVTDNSDALMLAYGDHAVNECKKVRSLQLVEFPDASRLSKSLGDNEERQEAFVTLRKLKQVIDSGAFNAFDNTLTTKGIHITQESLPDITADKVKELERHLIEQEVNHWQCITSDGKTIKVTIDPEEGSADINMTFAELFAVIGLKETFRVKELEIVYKPSSARRQDDI